MFLQEPFRLSYCAVSSRQLVGSIGNEVEKKRWVTMSGAAIGQTLLVVPWENWWWRRSTGTRDSVQTESTVWHYDDIGSCKGKLSFPPAPAISAGFDQSILHSPMQGEYACEESIEVQSTWVGLALVRYFGAALRFAVTLQDPRHVTYEAKTWILHAPSIRHQ